MITWLTWCRKARRSHLRFAVEGPAKKRTLARDCGRKGAHKFERASSSATLPSPSSVASHNQPLAQKRKRLLSNEPCLDEHTPLKRPRANSNSHEQLAEYSHDPVAHWVLTTRWPKAFEKAEPGSNQKNPSKRKSSSVHRSDHLRRLVEHGVYMRASALTQKSSKDLCRGFLTGDRIPGQYPCYPPEQIPNVLDRIQSLNEGRLQRDITPWVVPSAENLCFSGEEVPNYIGEEIQAEWTRCATMGSTRPKPDYTAGLLTSAFTNDEIEKLQNYASIERPFFFTPNLCYPFLICEAKTGLVGMDKADRQNIHSASVAVRAIIELYKAAFGTTNPDRVKDLYGKVLVFSVSHNNMQVNLYDHYAVLSDDSSKLLKFYRYDIAMLGLTMDDGAERFKAYNFVRNVYEKFAPEFRKMIRTAVACLSLPAKKTGPSFASSEIASEEMDRSNSQNAALQDDEDFPTPTEPASVSQRKELAKVKEQLERERKESNERINKLLQQMEQQRHESKELVEQQKEMISLLKQAAK